ncbi:MAG: hypothetical protein FD170_695 [Bacteroidetes bacterium]|nr:MAG: hypothetical protein FD170_695 [Bacteroidota bacterium]
MHLQYLTESIHLLPVCSILAISGGGYCNPVNCCQSLVKHCICSTGESLQFSGYLNRFNFL